MLWQPSWLPVDALGRTERSSTHPCHVSSQNLDNKPLNFLHHLWPALRTNVLLWQPWVLQCDVDHERTILWVDIQENPVGIYYSTWRKRERRTWREHLEYYARHIRWTRVLWRNNISFLRRCWCLRFCPVRVVSRETYWLYTAGMNHILPLFLISNVS